MDISQFLYLICILAPAILMAMLAGLARLKLLSTLQLWRTFQAALFAGLALACLSFLARPSGSLSPLLPGLVTATPLSSALTLLVQLLGTVIGAFSARYLQGETGQRRYIAGLAAVLASVHLLLIADHWLLLIAAWAVVGMALQPLLCFYSDRPFALLAAHKKRLADRLADILLLSAATLAWLEVGSGSLSALWLHISQQGLSVPLQISALVLVLAVALRTASLPVHGWLIQVMEAPTPVSALLHAGVINLGGFILIRFAFMLEHATPSRILLLLFGLTTTILAGLVMLTRISIKVQLAWSTVAQMGFMLLECALGLYTFAALHLIGHSLYKADAFLSASAIVRQTRLQALHGASSPAFMSLALAPVLTSLVVILLLAAVGYTLWPWWWSCLLGLAWAPLLWIPALCTDWPIRIIQALFGLSIAVGLTLTAMVGHVLPFGIQDTPHQGLGLIALSAMAGLYFCQMLLQQRPQLLSRWHRWSYAGFYVDEFYTRLALRIWPTHWTPALSRRREPKAAAIALAENLR